MLKTLSFDSHGRYELINVTQEINQVVRESGIETGVCFVFVPHATAALLINEDEKGLKSDLVQILSHIETLGKATGGFRHNDIDDNAHAHIGSSFLGQERAIPIMEGKLALGTWQEIFLAELDGPRNARKVIVSMISAA
jgi:secondary thiamine-phosphate synthase enzyme